ncbi:MAG TPA: TniQ family protein [Streptosporangiaceae bacterium]|nr:TniQ family protein [Streptosporangiaceae bacterium]
MTPRWPPLPRPLPRTLPPLHHETYDSYLNRLAAANHVSFDDLDEVAHPGNDDPAPTDQLTALTGYPATALLAALPELRYHPALATTTLPGGASPTPRQFINDIRPPCRRCAATAGADPQLARIWATHDANACLRHQLWTGGGNDRPGHQPALAAIPDIIHAQLRHQRIVLRRGRPATRSAFHLAQGSWAALITTPGYAAQHDARLARLHLPGNDPGARKALTQAAAYPEIVAFTAILASPYWRAILLARTPPANQRFHAEFRRRVAPGHHEHRYPRFLFWLRRDLEWHPDQPDETGPPP